MIGQTLSHYQVLEKLGEGGMGVVYRALDVRLNRPVAIKVLSHDAMADADRARRFMQEARAASALNHPHIITVHEVDASGGTEFIVMEYVTGSTLEHLIGRKGLTLSDALKHAVQIADALAAAHRAGIVHRDLKPGNVMITERGDAKVLDFGLAKLTERADEDALGATTQLALARTEAGTVLGTVAYMSPEQAEGKTVDVVTSQQRRPPFQQRRGEPVFRKRHADKRYTSTYRGHDRCSSARSSWTLILPRRARGRRLPPF